MTTALVDTKPGAIKTPKTPLVLDRVKALEELTEGLAGFVQQEVGQVKQALTNLVEVLNGVIAAGGEGFELKVQEAVNAAQAQRAAEKIEREKAMIAQLVATGVLVPADVVGEESIVVGREFSLEGQLLGSGRSQVRFSQFTEEAKEKVLGQAVGFVIEVPTGKFEVLEVYNQAPQKAPEVAEPVQIELPSSQPVAEEK
jgi:hypothetical protein